MVSGGVGGVAGVSAADTELEDPFDLREFLQRKWEKAMEDQSTAGKSSTAIIMRKKIKRNNVKANRKLLEMDPLANKGRLLFRGRGDQCHLGVAEGH